MAIPAYNSTIHCEVGDRAGPADDSSGPPPACPFPAGERSTVVCCGVQRDDVGGIEERTIIVDSKLDGRAGEQVKRIISWRLERLS